MTNSFQRSHMSTKSQGAKQNTTQPPQQYNISRNELKAGQDTHSNSIVHYGTPFQYTPNGTVHYGVPRQVLGPPYNQQFVASRYIQPYYAPQYYAPAHAQSYANIVSAPTEIHHPSFQNPSPQQTIGTFNQAFQRNLVQIAQNNQVLAQYNLQPSFIQPNPYNMVYTGYHPSPIQTRGSYISPVAINAIPMANHIYPKQYHWQNPVMSPSSIPQVIYHHPPSVSHHHIGFHQPAAIKCLPQTPPTPQSNSQSPLNNLQDLQTKIKMIDDNSELQNKLNSVLKPKSFSNNQMDIFRAQIMAYTMLAQNQKINEPVSKALNMLASKNSNEASPTKVLYSNSIESKIIPADDNTVVAINGRQTA